VGIPGAAIAGLIALVSLVSLYLNDSYRPAVVGTAVYYVLGILYFALSGRNRLVLSPEEEFALTRGEHGHPEREGYGTTHVDQIGAARPAATPGTPPPGGPTTPT
jgi:ethanolamine permease